MNRQPKERFGRYNSHFINIRVVNFIDKTNGWRFIRISIRKLYSNLPHTFMIRTCKSSQKKMKKKIGMTNPHNLQIDKAYIL